MRCALFTLIKRQLVDNAIYFAAAFLVTLVLIIATISVVLTEDRTYLSPYALTLLFAGPVLFCIGSYMVGFIQTRSDQAGGVAEILSVLPVSPSLISLARIVVGVLIILIVLGPLAITGALLWRFLGPPAWLFHDWLADLFIGLLLTTLTCYLFGLHASHKAKTLVSALYSLALTPIPLILIFIKGFGTPLLVVLVPLIFILVLRCCNLRVDSYLVIIDTGIFIMICLTILLFLGRYICTESLVIAMKPSVKISPSGLLSSEIENDPNVQEESEILAKTVLLQRRKQCVICKLLDSCNLMNTGHFQVTHYLLQNAGIMKYFLSRRRGEYCTYSTPSTPLPGRGRTVNTIHLDVVEGQLVHRHKSTKKPAERFTWQWDDAVTYYAGPDGVSSKPNNTGRFSSPTVFFEPSTPLPWRRFPPPCIVYDRDSKRFYFVDFEKQIIIKGPEIEDSATQPCEVGLLPLWEVFSPGEFRLTSTKSYRVRLPIEAIQSTVYLPIISKTGRIDLLDLRTHRIIGPVGQLPKPRTLFGTSSSEPRYLLDYDVDVVSVIPGHLRIGSDEAKVEIIGILAVSVSRQGMWTSVAVFDKDGNEIETAHSKTGLFDVPGGPALTIIKYLFESLHPPVLTLASYFTAYSFEARSSHRALFLMPNSFVAMARDFEGNIFWTILLVLALMLPGLLFSGVLGLRVARDAANLGLSPNAKRLWFLSTLAFGLPVYITYRFSRPKITLVTCTHCGKSRRLDTDTCHWCNSPWHVPEQTPPGWRILDR